jgi:hypothetical protein
LVKLAPDVRIKDPCKTILENVEEVFNNGVEADGIV